MSILSIFDSLKHKKQNSNIISNQNIEIPDNFVFNEEFQKIFNKMENSNENLLITGKAGTGKSTLLTYFRLHTKKKIAVVAPTGIAAVNVNAVTIHSFFHFPPKFIQKETMRRSRDKGVYNKIDTLIIDEISMVRADLLDGIDYALRINRNQMDIPFGGVQIIAFGDLYQLPPIVEAELRYLFSEKYSSPYFFSSDVFKEYTFSYRELNTIYRQTDSKFIELLNCIRNCNIAEHDLQFLNSRYESNISYKEDSRIILTSTNRAANQINLDRLNQLSGKEYIYEAKIAGEFNEKMYPTEIELKIKKQAKVILVRNDSLKRWVNGTIAEIVDLSLDKISVKLNNNIYEVSKEKWSNFKYVYNESEDKIEEEELGSFTQYPIKLAWAITIHKSQGQTFDELIIDLGRGAFAHGQLYVALSRCRTLEGITLHQPVIYSDMIFDENINYFVKSMKSGLPNDINKDLELKGKGEQILLVEDDDKVLAYLERILLANGYFIHKAVNSKDAVKVFKENIKNIDLVITDMILPDENGLDTIEQLKLIKNNIGVIICSGYLDDKSRFSEIQEKGYKFVQKPFVTKELFKTIKALLENKKAGH